MSPRVPYQYVVLRCVPRVDREEFINVGVVLHCQAEDFLAARTHLDPDRLQALASGLDLHALRQSVDFVEAVCRGEERLGGVAAIDLSSRFGFLKAPRSTVLQPGPVHGGSTDDASTELTRLLSQVVPGSVDPTQTGTRSTAPTR